MLVIRTGMESEAQIARAHADARVRVLTGWYFGVPRECTAIMSFGLCGGLRPQAPLVGQTLVASVLMGPGEEVYLPDSGWNDRLLALMRMRAEVSAQPWFSSGKVEGQTVAERAALFARTSAWAVDDESLGVARLARARGIPFVILRNVSDQWDDDVSVTSGMLDARGGVNVWEVLRGLTSDLGVMIHIGRAYGRSITELGVAAARVGVTFGWEAT